MPAILCPRCERAHDGECETVHRGRRFFLMGALALPVARKIECVAALVKPKLPYEAPKLIELGRFFSVDPQSSAARFHDWSYTGFKFAV